MKILVLRGGALGDFLVTLPALALLRARWPDARIELVGNARAAELGLLGGQLDAAHSQHEARWAALHRPAPLPAELQAWLAEFDLVVNYWPDPDGAIASRFPMRPGQTFLSAAALPTIAPAARHYCEALRPLGLATADFRARLDLAKFEFRIPKSEANDQRAEIRKLEIPNPKLATDRVALHPGSGSPRKNWPVERWAELCERWRERAPLLIVGGEADTAAVAALARFGPVAANLPLPDLARRLAGCRLFLGHDSGVSHLAAAVGAPAVLLFGPTDPAMWAPPGEHVLVLRSDAGLEGISVDAVESAVAARLG